MPKIGNLTLDAPFFQAGLAGYSDAAMRLVARRHGCPYAVTEAMLDQFLIQGGKGLLAAHLDPQDHPIAGQLMGSHPQPIAHGAKILADLGYDVVDVNLACPVKKIRKKARGGHLMQEPNAAVDILAAVRDAVPTKTPTTLKLRRGTDESQTATDNFHHIFQAAIDLGYAAATVHGRTVEQKYIGPSRWAFLKDLVAQYADTPGPAGPPGRPMSIFGSGDIFAAQDIFDMIRETGVAAVSVARGCIGNPWIFTQARALMAGDLATANQPPTIEQQRDVLLDHFNLSVALHGEKQAGLMMRKFGIKFSRHHRHADQVAKAFIAVKSLPDWQAVLDEHYATPKATQQTPALSS